MRNNSYRCIVCHNAMKGIETIHHLYNAEVIHTKKNERLYDAWEKEIQIVLETIYRMEQAKK